MQPQQPFQPSAPQGPPAGYTPSPQQPVSASSMKANKPLGLIVIVIVLTLLLIAVSVYGFMMMSSRNDFRDNAQEKIDTAVFEAEEKKTKELQALFIEEEKKPYKTYTGLSQFGTLSITYPKTWAAYVEEPGKGTTPINGYLHPNYVPDKDSGTPFALRFEVIEKSYDSVLSTYAAGVKRGAVKVSPITLDKVPSQTGSRIDGEVEKDKQGSVVLFPQRDKTIKVSVLSSDFLKDFNEIILKNMSYIP